MNKTSSLSDLVEAIITGYPTDLSQSTIEEHSDLIDEMSTHYLMRNTLSREHTDNLVRYFLSVPSELTCKLWRVIFQANMDNGIALFQSTVDGKCVHDFMREFIETDIFHQTK